jgi:transcriptional antiterminator NusG
MTWFVIRTNIKGEHKAVEEIGRLGFDCYLPEYKIERFNRRKKVTVEFTLCLFPRYMFVEVPTAGDLGYVRACNGVEDFLPGKPHEPQSVPTSQVMALRKAQADMLLDDTLGARRARGITSKTELADMRKRMKSQRVRVTKGPFSSFPGVVDKVHSMQRMRVLIDIFGRPTPVDLHMDEFEVVATAA